MAKEILIRLSVYPYIRRYLLFHYSEPFFITERGYIPNYLLNALHKTIKVDPKAVVRKDKKDYGAFIGVMVGEGTAKKFGNSVSGENVKRFNEAVSDLIHEEMYRLIHQLNKAGYQVDQTIREFQAMYGFTEDELPFENLKRWYYRERKRLAERAQERREVQPQYILNFFEEIESRKGVSAIIDQPTFFNQLSA